MVEMHVPVRELSVHVVKYSTCSVTYASEVHKRESKKE